MRASSDQIRSTLTTFLLTIALGAFGGYFLDKDHNPYFWLAGIARIVCANFVCFYWSALYMRSTVR